MNDLISKTALLKHLDMAMECENCPRNADKELYKCVHNPTPECCTCSDIAQICTRITEFADVQHVDRWISCKDTMPAADVQSIKHGWWIEEEPRVLKCSVCGEYAPMNYLGQNCIDSRYCPWCGT